MNAVSCLTFFDPGETRGGLCLEIVEAWYVVNFIDVLMFFGFSDDFVSGLCFWTAALKKRTRRNQRRPRDISSSKDLWTQMEMKKDWQPQTTS